MSFVNSIHRKIISGIEVEHITNLWKLLDQRIVFTNGCFDIVHKGHIEYLIAAADLGDRLIIGLNSDNSVKKMQKGASRPIQHEESRALVLASISFVSAVILFDDDTPAALIERIRPDVLVKGGDYEINQIAGADFVLKNAGEVKVIPLIPGYSTTAIENRIKSI